jgi:hypothetical protein
VHTLAKKYALAKPQRRKEDKEEKRIKNFVTTQCFFLLGVFATLQEHILSEVNHA